MLSMNLFVIAVVANTVSSTVGLKACGNPTLTKEWVTRPRAHEDMRVSDLPASFFWGNVNGTNFLTETRNQHIPTYCGACWAFGTLSSLSDRIKIMNKAAYPEVILAPQVLINCGGGGDCDGGDVGGVFDYLQKYGIPDETCQNYEATNDFQKECTNPAEPSLGVCETCAPNHKTGSTCSPIATFNKWTLASYAMVLGGNDQDVSGQTLSPADKLKAELYANGPLACGIHANDKLEAFGTTTRVDSYPGGIFKDSTLLPMANHILSIVGWGTDPTEGEYWVVRNSWGTYWGENGFMKIKMHSDNLGIEHSCSYADPAPMKPQETVTTTVADTAPKANYFDYTKPSVMTSTHKTEVVLSPRPKIEDAPAAWDVRNVQGKNYATIDRNQHIPQYCGSCWAHATTSALSDRFALANKVAIGGISWAVAPEVDLSPQHVVNCVTNNSQGCGGGDPASVYPYMYKYGIVDETCQNYQAKTLTCTAENTCINCDPDKGCYAMGSPAGENNFTKYTVREYGHVSGATAMTAEVGTRGPIACSICVTDAFENYMGGIFKDTTGCTAPMHSIAVSGYGTENGTDYWIVRNSWGTYWGERGWFKIARGVNNLGIEEDCVWAVPK